MTVQDPQPHLTPRPAAHGPVEPAAPQGPAASLAPAPGPLEAAELTDGDGDALTVTADAEGIWFTCTTDGEEVTVGPFPMSSLGEALDSVGAYVRVA